MGRINAIMRELRIEHYIKNFVVFIPFILNGVSLSVINFLHVAFLFLAFCLISSSVYIVNDLRDKEKDSSHPYKKFRPIAQNLISLKQAVGLAVILAGLSFFISLRLGIGVFICAYFLINMIYSFFLRNSFIIGAFCIAAGFVLRLWSSFYFLDISVYIPVICWMALTSTFFTFVKRKLELKTMKKLSIYHRSGLAEISEKAMSNIVYINATLSFLFFIITVFENISSLCFVLLSLFYVVIICRILFLADKDNKFDDPINFIRQDIFLKVVLFIFLLLLFCCEIYS